MTHAHDEDENELGWTTQNPQIEALKPCPLCGGKAELWRAHPENPKLNAWIACADRCLVLTQEFESDEAAVAHWNRRASQEAAAPSEEPVGYLFELCYSHEHDRWSGPMYSECLPKAEDVRNVRPLFASPAVAPVAVAKP